jgi:hypothetical protein
VASLVPTRVVALIPALDSERSSWAGALERLVTFVPTIGTKPAEVSPGAGRRDPSLDPALLLRRDPES